jgi:hypothetical protein
LSRGSATAGVPMITFLKRALEAYIDGAGRYPLPMLWTF